MLITGCAGKSTAKFIYRPENTEHWDSLYVAKTVYYDDRVQIKLDGEYSKADFTFSSPDDDSAVTEKKKDTLIFYSDHPSDIDENGA